MESFHEIGFLLKSLPLPFSIELSLKRGTVIFNLHPHEVLFLNLTLSICFADKWTLPDIEDDREYIGLAEGILHDLSLINNNKLNSLSKSSLNFKNKFKNRIVCLVHLLTLYNSDLWLINEISGGIFIF